jgi:uncharacterized protein involved in exopolysaccharide biosynthesis
MTEDQFLSEKPQTNILVQIIYRYFPFWPIFVLLTSLSLVVAYIYLRSQTKVYVASAKVLIKDPNRGSESKVLDAMNIFTEKKSIENEIIVLRSSKLMSEVVKQLDVYATVFNKGKVQTEELYGNTSPVYFIAKNKDSINSGGKYFFDVDWKKKQVSINNKTIAFYNSVNIAGTEYVIVPNEQYNQRAIGKNFYVVFKSVASEAGRIIGSLRATPISYGSTALDVRIETPVPKKGIDVLNKLFQVYNKEAIEDKNLIAKNTLRFIDDRLDTVLHQLDSVELNIEKFKVDNAAVNLLGQAELYYSYISELEKRKENVLMQVDALRSIERYVRSKSEKAGVVPSLTLVSDVILLDLLKQLYTAEFERDAAVAVAGEKSEKVSLANAKVQQLKHDVLENIGNVYDNFQIEIDKIDKAINTYRGVINTIPEKERILLDKNRQQQIKNNIYTYL